jgi:hypothetical protein
MKGVLLLAAGVAIGFVVAHQVAKTPQGKQFFDDVDSKAREFGSAVVDGYKAREAELTPKTRSPTSRHAPRPSSSRTDPSAGSAGQAAPTLPPSTFREPPCRPLTSNAAG